MAKVTTAPASQKDVVEATTGTNDQQASVIGHANIIKKLIATGCKRINSIRVKNVNWTEKDNYTMIGITLATGIKGFVTKDGGANYEEGITTTMFTSLFAIAGALKEDEDLAWMANALLDHPQALNLILNGGTIDILQQEVKAGEEYKNPFTTREDAEPQVYDHDVFINNIIGFKLGGTGLRMADKLADKMLGF